ncbi:MAG TPA: hypothetical protein VKV37_04280 [Ktedonobacteraceae bacterium]|nr:hypothetical protein [Ktedonobacteraceae bacterium]
MESKNRLEEVKALAQAVKEHMAQVQRAQISKRQQYGRAARKAQQKQQP